MGSSWAKRLNGATNRLYWRLAQRPHYLEVYRRMVDDAVGRADAVIHLGAGALDFAKVTSVDLAGKQVWAVDPDESALVRNPNPNRIVAFGEAIPLPDGCADAVVCEHVVEHLDKPLEVLREARRLLRPAGRFVFTTPNLLSYSGVATRLTPQRFHDFWIAKLRADGAARTEEPYPTHFRMNDVWSIAKLARQSGFEVGELFTGVDHPTYTYPLPGVHQLAAGWHMALDRIEWLAPFRITLTATLVRP
jgi:SAM-dependent methyltransferase